LIEHFNFNQTMHKTKDQKHMCRFLIKQKKASTENYKNLAANPIYVVYYKQ
jgi:hypothetical protein